MAEKYSPSKICWATKLVKLLPHSARDPGSILTVLSVQNLYVILMTVWVFSGCSNFIVYIL